VKNIPIYSITNETSLGLRVNHFKSGDPPTYEEKVLDAHRDDHYIFFVLEKNSRVMMVDFNEIEVSASTLYYILPTEVHQRIRNENSEGWSVAVDTALVTAECRNAFEGGLWLRQPYKLNGIQLQQFHNLMALLHEKYQEDRADPFYTTVVHSLLQSFLAIAAACYSGFSGASIKTSRPVELTNRFKSLLSAEGRSIKSPALYAERLNVSEGYLNESLKKITGFPVSYWIQQDVMREAKRLLYYTQLNVKEIAHTLGYADHSYFSRLFRKVTGTSAIAFRELYHG
jgi:AraC family transcriptional activator of pobA